ncbi:MAG: metalloregulator ArsR/SmtB family transcription factor [Candidatus Methanoplasma sp.]|jgi:SAM-dependent methyltransferase|nr:metalloregulator ArsR/SmtB family transcription factor [Candidatus Methanoplasma sp.]
MDETRVFRALGDGNRAKIVSMLTEGEMCACEILLRFGFTQPNLAYHMKTLCDSGLVRGRKEGRWMYYSLCPDVIDGIGKMMNALSGGKGGIHTDDGRRDRIREDYASIARKGGASCLCATNAYGREDLEFIPAEVIGRNQGCSSPLADAKRYLRRGDTIADLGCGAGLDVFIASRYVGPEGKAIGIDMTPEMLEVADRAKGEVSSVLGYDNTEFFRSFIEKLPLEDSSVDVVISNCVINLSSDKGAVFSEIFRVLRPDGRFIISDVFSLDPLPEYMKNDRDLISRCFGGAMLIPDLYRIAGEAGFTGIHPVHTDSYSRIDGMDFISATYCGSKPHPPGDDAGRFTAVLIGPPSKVAIETGDVFVRDVPAEVEASVAEMLRGDAYSRYFSIYRDGVPEKTEGVKVLPVPGPCVFTGKFAVPVGPFPVFEDDDRHVYRLGKALEICNKTEKVLSDPLYGGLVMITDRSAGRAVDAAETCCGPECKC